MYYCYKTYCQTNNLKLKLLAKWIKVYEYKVFEFRTEKEQQKLLDMINAKLNVINEKFRGREISVRKFDFNGNIQYEFRKGGMESVGCITLWPIKGVITFNKED